MSKPRREPDKCRARKRARDSRNNPQSPTTGTHTPVGISGPDVGLPRTGATYAHVGPGDGSDGPVHYH